MIENRLATGLDIDLTVYGLGVIRQPTVREIISLPFDDVDIPFLSIEQYYLDIMEHNYDENLRRLHLLPLLEELNNQINSEQRKKDLEENFLDPFIEKKIYYTFSYKFFTYLSMLYDVNIDDITVVPVGEDFNIIIKDVAVIDNDNFDILLKVIYKMFNIDVSQLTTEKDNWIEVTGSKREKELIEKFKKKELKRKEKNKYHICDYINYLMIVEKRTYKEILDWTYYQLMKMYENSQHYQRYLVERDVFVGMQTDLKPENIYDWQKNTKIEIDKSIY